jgi:hypothetical protein
MITQSTTIATSCVRPARRSASLHSHPIAGTLALALAAWLITCAVAYGQPLLHQAAPEVPVIHNSAPDKIQVVIPPSKHKAKIVATSDAGFTIHFSDCRENEKQHVSCSFQDEAGNQHWVYLPGVALPK